MHKQTVLRRNPFLYFESFLMLCLPGSSTVKTGAECQDMNLGVTDKHPQKWLQFYFVLRSWSFLDYFHLTYDWSDPLIWIAVAQKFKLFEKIVFGRALYRLVGLILCGSWLNTLYIINKICNVGDAIWATAFCTVGLGQLRYQLEAFYNTINQCACKWFAVVDCFQILSLVHVHVLGLVLSRTPIFKRQRFLLYSGVGKRIYSCVQITGLTIIHRF